MAHAGTGTLYEAPKGPQGCGALCVIAAGRYAKAGAGTIPVHMVQHSSFKHAAMGWEGWTIGRALAPPLP